MRHDQYMKRGKGIYLSLGERAPVGYEDALRAMETAYATVVANCMWLRPVDTFPEGVARKIRGRYGKSYG